MIVQASAITKAMIEAGDISDARFASSHMSMAAYVWDYGPSLRAVRGKMHVRLAPIRKPAVPGKVGAVKPLVEKIQSPNTGRDVLFDAMAQLVQEDTPK